MLTPHQPLLHDLGHDAIIRLTLKRDGDGQLANNAFDFGYDHHPTASACPYCDFYIDSNGPVSIQKPSERARPGTKKKQMKTIARDSWPAASPSPRAYSPVDSEPLSPAPYASPSYPSPPTPSYSPARSEAEDDVASFESNAEGSTVTFVLRDDTNGSTEERGDGDGNKGIYQLDVIDMILDKAPLPTIKNIIMESGSSNQGQFWTRNVLSRLWPSGQADPTNYSQLV